MADGRPPRLPEASALRLALILVVAAGLTALTLIAAPAHADHAAKLEQRLALMPPLEDDVRTSSRHWDWRHCVQVVANLRDQPPALPVVVLLGGSAARECTVNDGHWTRQIKNRGGPDVLAYNLGSRNRTYAEDLEFVKRLPRIPTIVYIGINLGRFCPRVSPPGVKLPSPAPLPRYNQHIYSTSRIQTASRKRFYVAYWMQRRYPEFKAHYRSQLGMVERIILTCKRRGLHVVLVDLPRDVPIIRHTFDAPVARYHSGCARLARKYGIPWLRFVAKCRFRDRDFFDIFHLVEPGRAKYQSILTNETIRLLDKYQMSTPSPSPSPSVSPSPSESPSPSASPSASDSASAAPARSL